MTAKSTSNESWDKESRVCHMHWMWIRTMKFCKFTEIIFWMLDSHVCKKYVKCLQFLTNYVMLVFVCTMMRYLEVSKHTHNTKNIQLTCSRPSTVAVSLSSSTPTYKGSFFNEILAKSSTFRVCVAEKSIVCRRSATKI